VRRRCWSSPADEAPGARRNELHRGETVRPAGVDGSTPSGAVDARRQSKKQGRAAVRLPAEAPTSGGWGGH
jgi:hypothetical protein